MAGGKIAHQLIASQHILSLGFDEYKKILDDGSVKSISTCQLLFYFASFQRDKVTKCA